MALVAECAAKIVAVVIPAGRGLARTASAIGRTRAFHSPSAVPSDGTTAGPAAGPEWCRCCGTPLDGPTDVLVPKPDEPGAAMAGGGPERPGTRSGIHTGSLPTLHVTTFQGLATVADLKQTSGCDCNSTGDHGASVPGGTTQHSVLFRAPVALSHLAFRYCAGVCVSKAALMAGSSTRRV
jgi:hypothetical protein